jgi:hypothetical protein
MTVTDPVIGAVDAAPSGTTSRHREVQVAAAIVVVLAFLLQVRTDARVAFRGLANYPIPHSCPSYAWCNLKCPGCGLTRGIIHLARGDLAAAQAMHPLSAVMAAVIVF